MLDLYKKWVIEVCNQEYRGQLGYFLKVIRKNAPVVPLKIDMRVYNGIHTRLSNDI